MKPQISPSICAVYSAVYIWFLWLLGFQWWIHSTVLPILNAAQADLKFHDEAGVLTTQLTEVPRILFLTDGNQLLSSHTSQHDDQGRTQQLPLGLQICWQILLTKYTSRSDKQCGSKLYILVCYVLHSPSRLFHPF